MRSTLWVVMEFCRVGSTLDVMRRQGNPLSEPQSAWVIRGMLYALDYMHTERRAIHRDIKAKHTLTPTPPLPLPLHLSRSLTPTLSLTLTLSLILSRRPTCCSPPTRASSSPT